MNPWSRSRWTAPLAAAVSLVAALTLAGAAAEDDDSAGADYAYVRGGGFEGSLTDWQPDSAGTQMRLSSAAREGRHAVELTSTHGGPASVRSHRPVVAATVAHAVYSIRVWAWVPSAGTRLSLAVQERADGRAAGESRTTPKVRTSGWNEFAVEHRARSDGNQLFLKLGWPGEQGSVRFDAVRLSTLAGRGPLQTAARDGGRAAEQDSTGPMLVGSNVYRMPGETLREAFARQQRRFGELGIVRVFYPGPPEPWARLPGGDELPVLVSFRVRPQDVLAGRHDAELAGWFSAAPAERLVYWTLLHEPQDDVRSGNYTTQQFVSAWRHVAGLAEAAGKDTLTATLVLSCWTLRQQSGDDWRDFYPGDDVVGVLGWDCYNSEADRGSYVSPETLLAPAAAASASVHKPWGVAELGSPLATGDDGSRRARWLRDSVDYLSREQALWVAYFDAPVGGSFELQDAPSVQAWREAVQSP